ncbi:reverse transcriptase (RNA-dependent DNA polymerase) [Hirsutella rhossiliensis]|uniref:Reverse transcriptase (RNA-dependent DNA polymerase) domain-containing protein n=1 Tax=Hirsutella rhossiliensis TaxID=111463 RepID=A0A9P8SLV8_9HYPO|nr:reverse transcriptase (RNA-dependent DNA polymerase) domain-containing protein [Hirsutella rhossiliensis]KAH0967923.1 reverse transcriptase (RNA-dependent DNA polymerase) domain-containing protein [Hirsutella rhossiliensis]
MKSTCSLTRTATSHPFQDSSERVAQRLPRRCCSATDTLPLIAETLQNLAKAKWFTKLDVVAAFHKIRMAPGHEERLHFARAYLDDVLIYSSGSKADHEAKVRRVLQALADAGLHLDPAKCEFSVQEVKYLGFLGFANYYRIFIPDYAKITQSLDALLKKGTAFHWGRAENEAFQELKRRFCESPVLKQWDPSLPTFLETDCSGYALGGVLSQEGPDGRRHACAFFSKRLSPAEYNYPIHDKEMLAIMRCLDNWNAELRSCGPFTILTDHRNLDQLSQFDFKLEYRPGSEAVVPDALSAMKVFEVADLQQLWDETVAKDSIFRAAYKAVRDRERAFPPSLGLKIQISECAIDAGKGLTFRDRIWVPGGSGEEGNQEEAEKDQLRTRIVQQSHDSVATGHPGRKSQLVRRRKGFLKPLPIPDRPRSHLSMDFITDLPPTGPSKARYLWVIVDRLTKAVTLECHYRFHGMPRSIVSDRGSNWLKRMNQEIEAYLRAYVSYVQDDWENCSLPRSWHSTIVNPQRPRSAPFR